MLSFNKVAGVGVFPWILVKFKNIYFVQNLRVTTFVLLKLTQFGFLYCVWIALVCTTH